MRELQSSLKFSGPGTFFKSPRNFQKRPIKYLEKCAKCGIITKRRWKKMQNTNSKKPKSISKLLYLFAILLWVINLTYSVMRLFFELSLAWNLLFFYCSDNCRYFIQRFQRRKRFPGYYIQQKILRLLLNRFTYHFCYMRRCQWSLPFDCRRRPQNSRRCVLYI